MWAGDDLEVATGRRVVVHLVARGLTRALELGQLGTVATSTTLQKSDDNITTWLKLLHNNMNVSNIQQ